MPIVPALAAILLLVVVVAAVPVLAGHSPAATATAPAASEPTSSAAVAAATATAPGGSEPTSSAAVRSDALARLRVEAVREIRPAPSGIAIAPIADSSIIMARLTTTRGQVLATWRVGDPQATERTVGADRYRVSVWRVTVYDSVEGGARTTSPPIAQCSTTVTLSSGTTTSLTATFAVGAQACAFGAPRISGS